MSNYLCIYLSALCRLSSRIVHLYDSVMAGENRANRANVSVVLRLCIWNRIGLVKASNIGFPVVDGLPDLSWR